MRINLFLVRAIAFAFLTLILPYLTKADDPCTGFEYVFPDGSNIIPCGDAANTTSGYVVNSNTGPTTFPLNGDCGMPLADNNFDVGWVSLTVQNGAGTWEWQLNGSNLAYEIYYAADVCNPDCFNLNYLSCGTDFNSWQIQTTPEAVPEIKYYIVIWSTVPVDPVTGTSFNLKYRRACGESCPEVNVTAPEPVCIGEQQCWPINISATGGTPPYDYYFTFDTDICDGTEAPTPVTELCATESGIYTVYVVDQDNCIGTTSIDITVSPDVDMDGILDCIDPVIDDCPPMIGMPCDDNDPCTINDALNNVCDCVGTPQDCNTGPSTVQSCNDGDPCTINDVETILDCDGSICVPCAGIVQDCSDGPSTVQSCDDGDSCTINDVETILDCDGSICVPCAGIVQDCSDGPSTVQSCDDGNPCTINDVETVLDCDGTICIPCIGIASGCDDAPTTIQPCDDGDPCTINDVETISDCGGAICVPCAGIQTDCDTGTTELVSCDDGDPCTVNDQQLVLSCDGSICGPCNGIFEDTDGDGVCDSEDLCQGFDDNLDIDMDGVPDDCDEEFSDLELIKTVDQNEVNVGEQITYTITLSNLGPDRAENVTVLDLLPAGLTFTGSNTTNGTYNALTGIWNIGLMQASEVFILEITATVDQPGIIINEAQVETNTSTDNDSTPGNDILSEDDQDQAIVEGLQVDIEVQKFSDVSQNTGIVNLGDPVNYTITVINNGPGDATGVQIMDIIPSNLTYSSSAPSGYDNSSGLWSIGNLPSGASQTLLITAITNQVGTVKNIANLENVSEPDSNPNNNLDDDIIEVVALDLAIVKTVDNAMPNVNDQIIYSITLTNNGPIDATNIEVTDVLPAGLTFVLSTSNSYNPNNGDFIWNIPGPLSSGASESIEIYAIVNDANTAILNIAEITNLDQTDNNPDNDSDQVALLATESDLSLSKSVNVSSANVGETITYTIELNNTGPSDATGVIVSDVLPSQLNYISSNAINGVYDDVTGQWNIGIVPSGSSFILEIMASVVAPGLITNTAEVISSDQYDPDSTPGNNTLAEDDQDEVTIEGLLVDLEILKISDINLTGDGTANVGDEISYTIEVTNNGPSTATDILVSDFLPSELQFISDSPSQGIYDFQNGTWSLGNLALNESASLIINAEVVSSGAIENIATITDVSETEINLDNNEDNDLITGLLIDIGVEKSVNSFEVFVGDGVTYSIDVTNYGPDNATGIEIIDNLPNGLSNISNISDNGMLSGTEIIWEGLTLNTGETITLTFNATVTESVSITNEALFSVADQFDGNPDNNSDQVSILGIEADLELTKTVSQSLVNVGDDVIYTIEIENNGPSNATGVLVSDILDSNLIYFTSNSSTGSYDPVTGLWDIGNLAAGETQTLSITVEVNGAGIINNAAAIINSDQPDPDSDPTVDEPIDDATDDEDNVDIEALLADLAVSKQSVVIHPEGTIVNLVGDTVIYTIEIINNGPTYSTDILLQDVLPDELTFIEATPFTGIFDETTLEWSISNMEVFQTATLQLTAIISEPGTIQNIAQLSSIGVPDPNTTNNADDDILETVPSCPNNFTSFFNTSEICGAETVQYTLQFESLEDAQNSIVTVEIDGFLYNLIYDGNTSHTVSLDLENTGCAPLNLTLPVSIYCIASNQYLNFESDVITAYPNEVESFITITDTDGYCGIQAIVDPSCAGFLEIAGLDVLPVTAGINQNVIFCYEYNSGSGGCFDIAGCLEANQFCPCGENDPGVMPSAIQVACWYEAVNSAPGYTQLGPDDVLAFVLHNGDLSEIYGITLNAFINDGTYPLNEDLFISAVVGPPGPDGLPSFLSPCTDVALPGTPVRFLSEIVIEHEAICNEEGDYTVAFSVSGGQPAIDASASYLITGDYNGEVLPEQTYTFGPKPNGSSYYIEVVDDSKGCSAVVSEGPIECVEPCPEGIAASANLSEACSGETVSLTHQSFGLGTHIVSWTMNGMPLANPSLVSLTNTNCAPQTMVFEVTGVCESDPTIIQSDQLSVTVYPSNIEPFVSLINDGCAASLQVVPGCEAYVSGDSFTPADGAQGTASLTATYLGNDGCAQNYTTNYTYDCQTCPDGINATVSQGNCSGDVVMLSANLIGTGGATISWTANGQPVANPMAYTLSNSDCAPLNITFEATAVCDIDPTVTYSDQQSIMVYPNDISAFVSLNANSCGATLSPIANCVNYIDTDSFTAAEGSSGTATLTVNYTANPDCAAAYSETVNYDCISCPTGLQAMANTTNVCNGDAINLNANVFGGGSATVSWTANGQPISNPSSYIASNANCTSTNIQITAVAVCDADPSVSYTDQLSITVGPSDVEQFVTVVEEDCFVALTVASGCEAYIQSTSFAPMPGQAGSTTLSADYFNAQACAEAFTTTLSYDCPDDNPPPPPVECPDNVTASLSALSVCSGQDVELLTTVAGSGSVLISWQANGVDVNGNIYNAVNNNCAPSTVTLEMTAVCEDDNNQTYSESFNLTVYPSDISSFVETVEQDCFVAINPISGCENYITGSSFTASEGESGTVDLTAEYSNGISCIDSHTVSLSYNCASDPDPQVLPDCDDLDVCTQAITPIDICIECLIGSDAVIDTVESLFFCAIQQIDDACFTYTPLPGMESVGADTLTVTYCTEDGNCASINVFIEISDCNPAPPDQPEMCVQYYEDCSEPMVPITVCLDCDGGLDTSVEIDSIASTWHCTIDMIDGTCFSYIPLPNMDLVPEDSVFIWYCDTDFDVCDTAVLVMTFVECDENPIEEEPEEEEEEEITEEEEEEEEVIEEEPEDEEEEEVTEEEPEEEEEIIPTGDPAEILTDLDLPLTADDDEEVTVTFESSGVNPNPHTPSIQENENDPEPGISIPQGQNTDMLEVIVPEEELRDEEESFIEIETGQTMINLYPVPVKDFVHLELQSETEEEIWFTLMNVEGKVLYSGSKILKTGNQTVRFNMLDYAGGMYILQVQMGDRIESMKFIKQE